MNQNSPSPQERLSESVIGLKTNVQFFETSSMTFGAVTFRFHVDFSLRILCEQFNGLCFFRWTKRVPLVGVMSLAENLQVKNKLIFSVIRDLFMVGRYLHGFVNAC